MKTNRSSKSLLALSVVLALLAVTGCAASAAGDDGASSAEPSTTTFPADINDPAPESVRPVGKPSAAMREDALMAPSEDVPSNPASAAGPSGDGKPPSHRPERLQ